MTTFTTPAPYDAVVIGGGPAGLQAALTLGRVHRRVLLLDSGQYRNDPTDHAHNFLTRDGTPPAELRAIARAELAAYPTVEVRDTRARTVTPQDDGGFLVETDAGHAVGRTVLLATGLRDTLPDVPGLAALFGTVAAHCPFCHGHEYAGTHVAVIGSHAHVDRVAFLMEPIAARLTVITDGAALDPTQAAVLDAAGVAVRTEPLAGLDETAEGAVVRFVSGPDEEVGGIIVATTFAQAAPFADQLGLTLLGSGCVEVDAFGRTSLPGVYAAGDAAHQAALPMPMAAVVAAASAGMVAASTVAADLIASDHPAPVTA